ncbi:MAG: MFS transporter [Kordiimonadaceae bacterium]|nr:MFS transporter [Kordiimonadaceae bacterium]
MPDSGNAPVEEDQAADTPAISKKMRNYTLAVLTLVYTFNFVDRQILVIMSESIKNELLLSDTQLGLLTGLAFAMFYVSVGIPIAYFADRMNRRNIIAASLTVWSAMTALSGFAQNYSQLLLARVGVGVGEAGGSPPAHSMISDMFDKKSRATALAIYTAGLYLGVTVGFILGGFLVDIYGWRATFMIVGIPGVLLALVLRYTVIEPQRGVFEKTSSKKPPSFWETLAAVKNMKCFPYVAFGCAMSAFVSYGSSNFMPSLLIRYHDMAASEVGLVLGPTAGVGGMIGAFMGGYLTDKYASNNPSWYLWLPGLVGVFGIPLGIFAFQTDNTTAALVAYFFFAVMGTLYLAPSIAVVHRLVEPRMRAMSSAMLFFVLNLIGLGLGPLFVGFLSDMLANAEGVANLRLALTIATPLALVKGYAYWKGGILFKDDLKRVEGTGG